MSKTKTSLLALSAIFSLTIGNAQTVDEIVAKHIDAVGGKDKLSQVNSMYVDMGQLAFDVNTSRVDVNKDIDPTLFEMSKYSQIGISYGNNASAGKYYNIRGIKMYCETYGEGRPLLMIHGNGGSINSFAINIPYFSSKYKVIAVDSRSQGKSADINDSLSFEMMADDFAVLLDTLHIKSAYVLGWSDGGINALLLAIRHPGKVIKLASTGANLWPDSTAFIPSAWKEMNEHYDTSLNKKFVTAKDKNDWKLFLLDFKQPHIPLSALHKINCPSLIIGGDHDLIPVPHTRLIAQNIPHATLWIVPNSGHATLMEHKDEFNKKVDAFFSGN